MHREGHITFSQVNSTNFKTYGQYIAENPRVVPPPDEFGSVYYHAPAMGSERYTSLSRKKDYGPPFKPLKRLILMAFFAENHNNK